jgi:hypothetical protein
MSGIRSGVSLVTALLYVIGLVGIVSFPVAAQRETPNAALANLIVDGGFELGGIPNTNWNPETSTNFGTPLCDVPSCGTGGGASPPRSGAFWAWFGGIPAAETATIGQTVVIPAGVSCSLNFWLRIGTVSAPFTDVLRVRVDGVIQATYTEPSTAEGAYTKRTVNLNSFANGAAHQILFEYVGTTTGTGSFVVDDVDITAPTAATVKLFGRVLTPTGAGLRNAQVFMQDSAGNMRTATTGAFGFYSFELTSAKDCILWVASKRYRYGSRSVHVGDNVSDLDFAPE